MWEVTAPVATGPAPDAEGVVDAMIDPERRGELYPLYDQLREIAPVHRTAHPAFHGGWITTGYAEGVAVLRSANAITDASSLDMVAGGVKGAWYDLMGRTMLFVDPASHQRLRRLVVRAFSREMVERLRPRTQQIVDDLTSALVAVRDDGRSLSEPELVAMCVFLLQAGHETTADMLGNAMVALFRHPDQLDLLARRPTLAAGAVEELLRYCSGTQFSFRKLTADLVVGGLRLRAGETVVVGLGAANRDPARFPDPGRLDLQRSDNAHVSFGYGSHLCVGAALARMETRVALRTLLHRAPAIRPEDRAPSWRPTLALRGVQHLAVRWD